MSIEARRDALGKAGEGWGGLGCGDEAESSVLKVSVEVCRDSLGEAGEGWGGLWLW